MVSTPHGRAVPLELECSAEGGLSIAVSTPHGRAVPLEHGTKINISSYSFCFNPSWESRPSGTFLLTSLTAVPSRFQPLMGEPSLWNRELRANPEILPKCFNPSWESRPSGTSLHRSTHSSFGFVSTPHGTARPLELVYSQRLRFQRPRFHPP